MQSWRKAEIEVTHIPKKIEIYELYIPKKKKYI